MRQYAWYIPELDVIIFQTIMENCEIAFEWCNMDLIEANKKYGLFDDINTFWYPLGEL